MSALPIPTVIYNFHHYNSLIYHTILQNDIQEDLRHYFVLNRLICITLCWSLYSRLFKISALSFAFRHHEHMSLWQSARSNLLFIRSLTHGSWFDPTFTVLPSSNTTHNHGYQVWRFICAPTDQVKVQSRCKYGLWCTCEYIHHGSDVVNLWCSVIQTNAILFLY